MINWKTIISSNWWRKWIYRPYETRTYKSVSKMFREKHGFLYEIWFTIRCRIKHAWEWPGDQLREHKWACQRIRDGVSEGDIWGFDYYLSNVILKGLKYLKKNKHGCPCLKGFGIDSPNDQTDEQFKAMQKEWDRILDTMIFTFEITKKVQDHDLIIPEGDEYFTNAEYKKYKRYCARLAKREKEDEYDIALKCSVISKKQFLKYCEGFRNFSKFYYSLWD